MLLRACPALGAAWHSQAMPALRAHSTSPCFSAEFSNTVTCTYCFWVLARLPFTAVWKTLAVCRYSLAAQSDGFTRDCPNEVGLMSQGRALFIFSLTGRYY